MLVLTAAPKMVDRKVASEQMKKQKKLCTVLQDVREVASRTALQPAHKHCASYFNMQGCNFTNRIYLAPPHAHDDIALYKKRTSGVAALEMSQDVACKAHV